MATYFIVGGSSGIGLQLAQQLSAAGHQVFATYNTHLQQSTTSVTYARLNVLADNIDLSFLPAAIDGLVYCPGSINLKPFSRLLPSDFANDYNLSVIGAVKCIQAALPKLKSGTNPSVILFSTVAVRTGLPFHAQVAASKGAVEGLIKALAAELAPRIRVNCIAPSLTDTPLAAPLLNTDEKKEAGVQRHPLKKIGSPQNIADAAEFLLSEKAVWITGQVLAVDGGMGNIKV